MKLLAVANVCWWLLLLRAESWGWDRMCLCVLKGTPVTEEAFFSIIREVCNRPENGRVCAQAGSRKGLTFSALPMSTSHLFSAAALGFAHQTNVIPKGGPV